MLSKVLNIPIHGDGAYLRGNTYNFLSPAAPFLVINIGGGHLVSLLDFIGQIKAALGRRAKRNYLGVQPGDVSKTEASAEFLDVLIGYRPRTPVSIGMRVLERWYRE